MAALLVAVSAAGCGAPAPSRTPTPAPTAAATTRAITVDPCVVGTWVAGPFSGPKGTGLAGLVLQIDASGRATALLDNATPIGTPPTTFQGQAALQFGTGVITSAGGMSTGTLTVASEDDSAIQTTASGVSGSLGGKLWDTALYSCGPSQLHLTFQTAVGGYLGGSSVTLSR